MTSAAHVRRGRELAAHTSTIARRTAGRRDGRRSLIISGPSSLGYNPVQTLQGSADQHRVRAAAPPVLVEVAGRQLARAGERVDR
jgi:hypothetical protein